jgi:hypothetical protein
MNIRQYDWFWFSVWLVIISAALFFALGGRP